MAGDSIFIFRTDLRLDDNLALLQALKNSKTVLACFIFDPRQVQKNAYRSDHAVQFLIDSLVDLNDQLKTKGGQLYVFYGEADEILDQILKSEKMAAVYVNADYSPFSRLRDQKIKEVCERRGRGFYSVEDALVSGSIESGLKSDKSPYTIFTPFFRNASRIEVGRPEKNLFNNYRRGALSEDLDKIQIEAADLMKKRSAFLEISPLAYILPPNDHQQFYRGGRKQAENIFEKLRSFDDYQRQRDFPSLDATTHLSAHLKFGTVSVREVYFAVAEKLGPEHGLIRQLYWRDFFKYILYYFPHVLGNPFHMKYANIRWENNVEKFDRWCVGKTGFPLVDAGMRELNQTGYMHNRVRMVVASFLTKNLHIDWRWGEKYFAQKLVDYDVALNNGNWQWAASTGCDAQPYFRIFNPLSQQMKFDAEAQYIKKWVPELANLAAEEIHKITEQRPLLVSTTYPEAMVDQKSSAKFAKDLYKMAGGMN